MTVQQLIDSLLRELDASSVFLDSPVVVKLGDRTYEADLCGKGPGIAIVPGTPAEVGGPPAKTDPR